MTSGRALRERVRAVLRLDDPPWRIAAALAVGVFVSCTPFYGFQTLLSLLIAVVLRLNKPAVVVGTWLNLPWFAPLVYGAALWVGGRLVPDARGMASEVTGLLTASGSFSWLRVVTVLENLSVPLLVGTTVVGGVAGLATYVVALGVLRRRRTRSAGQRIIIKR